MQNQLVPERRADRNGRVVTRHVRAQSAAPARGSGIPGPAVGAPGPFGAVRLKELDSGALTLALLAAARELEGLGSVDYSTVFDALQAAAFLHRDQTRANRKDLPRTPYIEHPLRNALRITRWGCADQDVIVAAVLHDTVEDCSGDIVRHYLGREDADALSEGERRELSLGWIRDQFGEEVARVVEAVSNPLRDESGLSKQRKRELYAEHVAESIRDDERVFIVKFADFNDNALGLPHNDVEGNGAMVRHLAAKYRPVAEVFEREYEANPRIAEVVGDEGYALIGERIAEADERLAALLG